MPDTSKEQNQKKYSKFKPVLHDHSTEPLPDTNIQNSNEQKAEFWLPMISHMQDQSLQYITYESNLQNEGDRSNNLNSVETKKRKCCVIQ